MCAVHGFTALNPIPAGTSILSDVNNEKGKNAGQRYELTKLLDVFLTRQIASLPAANGVVVNAVNPGFCSTGFGDGVTGPSALALKLLNLVARTAESGARNVSTTLLIGFIRCRPWLTRAAPSLSQLAWACTTDTTPGAYVSVTSVRKTSSYSTSKDAYKFEGEIWNELVDEWSKIEPKVKQIVG